MAFTVVFLFLFSLAGQPLLNAYFGQGTGPIVLANVQCAGNENQLLACSSTPIFTFSSNCAHSEDAGVRCEGIYMHLRWMHLAISTNMIITCTQRQ